KVNDRESVATSSNRHVIMDDVWKEVPVIWLVSGRHRPSDTVEHLDESVLPNHLLVHRFLLVPLGNRTGLCLSSAATGSPLNFLGGGGFSLGRGHPLILANLLIGVSLRCPAKFGCPVVANTVFR